MNGDALIDTPIVIALFAGETEVTARFASTEGMIYIPCIVIGELTYGACNSLHIGENLARIDRFVEANVILPCDRETARIYGKIKSQLKEKGRPIPENDLWIAAIAIQHDLTLISRDRHFEEIDGLKRAVW